MFNNYIEGWLVTTQDAGISTAADIESSMKSLPKPLPASSIPYQLIRDHFQRGLMTLELMKQVT